MIEGAVILRELRKAEDIAPIYDFLLASLIFQSQGIWGP